MENLNKGGFQVINKAKEMVAIREISTAGNFSTSAYIQYKLWITQIGYVPATAYGGIQVLNYIYKCIATARNNARSILSNKIVAVNISRTCAEPA